MAARLMESLATTAPLAELFSDATVLQAMLEFEVALARVEARLKIIPRSAAQAISSAANPGRLDATQIAAGTLGSGTPAAPFVRALTELVRSQNATAAGYVHWGATSQDVCDTALVLLLRKAQGIFESDLRRLEKALHRLAEKHRSTVMLGRTLMQPAPPVTFGLKAAGWLGSIRRSHQRLASSFDQALVLQFGGASGTLASLGQQGRDVAQALAKELKLACPEAPWHAHRDRLAELVCACGVLTGSLGKMARDIGLLAQHEVAELAEPGAPGRGGSSTMPHKQNPVGSAATLAVAQRVPGLVASFLSAMVQEHERALGGWQAEWPVVSEVVQSTGLALVAMAETAEGLTVDEYRMQANLEAAHGLIFAERAAMLLAQTLGREPAHDLIKQAATRTIAEQRNFTQVLLEMPEISDHVGLKELRDLENPQHYLGSAEAFRKALLRTSASAGTRRISSLSKKR